MKLFYRSFLWIFFLLMYRQASAQIPGSLDSTFQAFSGFNFGQVEEVVLQSTGKIIVIGQFRTYGLDSAASGMVRLNTDGSIDHTFNQGGKGAAGGIRDIEILSDDKILIGGTSLASYLAMESPA